MFDALEAIILVEREHFELRVSIEYDCQEISRLWLLTTSSWRDDESVTVLDQKLRIEHSLVAVMYVQGKIKFTVAGFHYQ